MKIIKKKRKNGSVRLQYATEGATRTEQAHANEVNINTIMARVEKGQTVPINTASPLYGDFTGVSDYQTACDTVIQAQDDFMALPAKVRSHFDNDPAKLIDFIQNPDNKKEAIELGLVEVPEVHVPKVGESLKTPEIEPEGPNTDEKETD